MPRMLLPALLLPVLFTCCLPAPASASRTHGARALQTSTAYGSNSTAGGHNSTATGVITACGVGYNGTVTGCNATAGNYNATGAGHNATTSAHNATIAAGPLPPQHLFQHGRKCGLDHISHSDQAAARAVKPHSGIAEGGVSIVVQVLR